MCRRYGLRTFANFFIMCYVWEFLPHSGGKFHTQHIIIIRKFPNFVRLYLRHITIFSNQILEFYYFRSPEGFFPGISSFFVWICLDQKLVLRIVDYFKRFYEGNTQQKICALQFNRISQRFASHNVHSCQQCWTILLTSINNMSSKTFNSFSSLLQQVVYFLYISYLCQT